MTKKNYALIAEAIRRQVVSYGSGKDDQLAKAAIAATARRIADALELDSASFKRALFIEACGFPLPCKS